MTALVTCSDVSRTYGRGTGAVVALHGASCTVTTGARVALVGPSGSGKSTLLHLLAGLDQPTTGTIDWQGLGGPPHEVAPGVVGLIFQNESLIPALDVTENVALPLLLAGEVEDEATRRAVEALRSLGIESLAHQLPQELSGGQSQRVAVARAIVARPRLVLADEPTGQLDHESADQVIKTLLAALGPETALVVTTHDPVIAAQLADRWEMADGRLLISHGVA